MTFEELHLSKPVLMAVKDKEYITPTPIQTQTIPVAMNNRDVLGLAQTGTGKTAAFAIPIIEQLLDSGADMQKYRRIQALVVTPTRELAIQIDESFKDYGKYTNLRHTVVFGGVNQNPQVKALQRGVDILVATPGRLLDLIGQKFISLDSVKYFVLDEADRMLDMGFIHDIKKLMTMLPPKRQTMLFSATMPKDIDAICRQILKDPVRVEVTPESSTVDTIDQYVCFAEKPEKIDTLVWLLNRSKGERILVFSRTKHGADKIVKVLDKRLIPSEAIHGNKSQNARQKALNDFKSGKTKIIIATDIAARGIDVEDLGVVINYDLPEVAETYVHRIGRTGRAGHSGTAYSICSSDERGLYNDIQKLTGKKLEKISMTA